MRARTLSSVAIAATVASITSAAIADGMTTIPSQSAST
jgi:hypothetical protein